MTGKGTYTIAAARTGSAANADELKELIIACCRDERKAQRRLYDTYAGLIFGIIRRFTADQGIAEDIHSEAFYRIFKRLDQYRFDGAFEGWIRRIAINATADYFRKQRPQHSSNLEDTEEVPMCDDIDGPSQLAYKELLAIIHSLPPMQRAVFNLFVFEQYAHKEIAALLGITENNSRWHLNDARRRAKEQITATNR